MRYDRALCGEKAVHNPHEYGPSSCRGWSAAQAETARLIDRLNQFAGVLRDEFLPIGGAKLECHPSVVNALHQMVLPEWGDLHEDPLKPSIPIMTNTSEMQRGEWRIVLDDGKIES